MDSWKGGIVATEYIDSAPPTERYEGVHVFKLTTGGLIIPCSMAKSWAKSGPGFGASHGSE